MSLIRTIRSIESAIPPWTQSAPPERLVRAACGVTGIRAADAILSTAATSAAFPGRMTTSGGNSKSSVSSCAYFSMPEVRTWSAPSASRSRKGRPG